jgi:4-alpha-glucanotransferase
MSGRPAAMTDRPALCRLSRRVGILDDYVDNRQQRRPTLDSTRELLLVSLGYDVSSEASASAALASLNRKKDRLLGPVAITSEGSPSLRLALPSPITGTVDWRIEIVRENGVREDRAGDVRVMRSQREIDIALGTDLAAGYYSVRAAIDVEGRTIEDQQEVIVAPDSCVDATERLDGRRFGIHANLYAARGLDDWGAGDFAQLRDLVDYAAASRAAFVGINPLHALRNRAEWISPYSPLSRLYRNILYIDIASVPELEHCPEARGLIGSPGFDAERSRLRARDHVDYAGVMRIKRPVLDLLHECFRRRSAAGESERSGDYRRFREHHGDALVRFATFRALEEHFGATEPRLRDWREWPDGFRDPRSEDVRRFRESNTRAVDFHAWIQFEIDRQMRVLSKRASAAGMRIGLFGDLAIGSSPGGADDWAFSSLFLDGVSIGAPPDDYSATGQDWGLPPIHPIRLADDAFRYWRLLIRNALESVGALRIDHVMGLFRQFWIPAGRSGTEGAYMRFPSDEMLAILALESRRANAIIIGEDLGTVPRGLPAMLAKWNILSTRVLYFERERTGAFRASRRYSRRALVTANTHDMPPLAGFRSGRDLVLRREIGALDAAAFAEALADRERARSALLSRLATERILPAGAEPGPVELCTAVHRFLAHTPSPLMGVSLDDLTGETEPVNVPGVTWERYSSWTRRNRLAVEDLRGDAAATRALSGVRERTRRA